MELLTLKQALQETHGILNGISVPIGLLQQIGIPIMNAMGNLQQCIDSIGDPPEPAAEEPAVTEDQI